MSLSKFKVPLLIFFTLLFVVSFMTTSSASDALKNGIFTPDQCLETGFQLEVSHKGWPFGLTENILKMQKEKCIITVEHEKLMFLKNKWEIDICREPVHVKSGTGAINVIQREGSCLDSEGGKFCGEVDKILKIIQDDGLIFAQGEREDLSSDHGRVYCAYLLLERYLRNGDVFSRHGFEGSLFGDEQRRRRPERKSREKRRKDRRENHRPLESIIDDGEETTTPSPSSTGSF